MTLVIDCLTWLVLVPMLMSGPDTALKAFWHKRMYCFESYNVRAGLHGAWGMGGPLLRQDCCCCCAHTCCPLPTSPAPPVHTCCRLTCGCHPFACHSCCACCAGYACCVQQHGFNAVMMLGELLLNRIPGGGLVHGPLHPAAAASPP
jgi:hypothetical protein